MAGGAFRGHHQGGGLDQTGQLRHRGGSGEIEESGSQVFRSAGERRLDVGLLVRRRGKGEHQIGAELMNGGGGLDPSDQRHILGDPGGEGRDADDAAAGEGGPERLGQLGSEIATGFGWQGEAGKTLVSRDVGKRQQLPQFVEGVSLLAAQAGDEGIAALAEFFRRPGEVEEEHRTFRSLQVDRQIKMVLPELGGDPAEFRPHGAEMELTEIGFLGPQVGDDQAIDERVATDGEGAGAVDDKGDARLREARFDRVQGEGRMDDIAEAGEFDQEDVHGADISAADAMR